MLTQGIPAIIALAGFMAGSLRTSVQGRMHNVAERDDDIQPQVDKALRAAIEGQSAGRESRRSS